MGRKDKSVRTIAGQELLAGQKMRLARQNKDIKLSTLAKQLNYSISYLSTVENGKGSPPPELVAKYEYALQMAPGTLLQSGEDVREQEVYAHPVSPPVSEPIPPSLNARKVTKEYSGEAPSVANMGGRKRELASLRKWIVEEHCKVVVIYGLGGIGKTTLASLVREQLKNEFEYIYWRSLQNAPLAEDILRNAIHFLSDHQKTPTDPINDQIVTFIQYLQQHRCLIVFDNVESILRDETDSAQNYAAYHLLMRYVGTTDHQSCIIFTSRERPKEIIPLEGKGQAVRSMQLRGMESEEARKVLDSWELYGTAEEWVQFVQFYGGNLLALKLVSEQIRDVFAGKIAAFLQEETRVVGDVDALLHQQFSLLSELEQEIMYWLAIEREPISRQELFSDIIAAKQRPVDYALSLLQRRSMIEKHGQTGNFLLQPVITEYLTSAFIDQIYDEIMKEQVRLLASHALIKAQTEDYIRTNQQHFILEPLATRLRMTLGKERSERKIERILAMQRAEGSDVSNYVAGNLLNLLIQLKANLRQYDFSHLEIQQAYLQGMALHGANFAYAHFERSIFNDNFGGIFVVAVSANGAQLAAGTDDGEIRLWELASTRSVRTFYGHTDCVRSVAFCPVPDSHLLVSGAEDQEVRLWNVETGECLHVLEGHKGRVYAVAFSPDGRIVASCSHDKTIRLWDAETEECLNVLKGHEDRVYAVAFSPDGRTIASGSRDKTIRLWDTKTGRCLNLLRGHSLGIRSIAFSPVGDMLASGSEDRTVRLWDTGTGECRRILRLHEDRVWSVTFDPSGDMLASGSDDQKLRLWDPHTGECLNILEGTGSRVYSVAFSPREKNILVSGSDRQTIQIWNAGNGTCLKTLRGYGCRIYALAFNPLSNMLVSGSEDQTIRFWDVAGQQPLTILRNHTHWIWSVAFNANGSKLASGSEDWTIRLWNVEERTLIRVLKEENSYRVYCVAFNADGDLLASGSTDERIKLWDLASGKCRRMLIGHTNRVRSVAFSANGHLLASGSDDETIKLWNPITGECINTLTSRTNAGHTNKVRAVAFSPDEQHPLLASGSDDKTVKVWNPIAGRLRMTLTGHTNRVTSIVFNPQGTMLASGSEDKTVRLWNSQTGDCLQTFSCHAVVNCVAFNADGSLLASGDSHGMIDIWDMSTYKHIQVLKSEGPYEGVDITGVGGLTTSQRAALKALGAIEKQ